MINKIQPILLALCLIMALIAVGVAMILIVVLVAGQAPKAAEDTLLSIMLALFVPPLTLAGTLRLLRPSLLVSAGDQTDA